MEHEISNPVRRRGVALAESDWRSVLADSVWSLSNEERATLERALDALLPPAGSFPAPSQTGMIDAFILQRVPDSDPEGRLYPALDAPALARLLAGLQGAGDMTAALADLERREPLAFTALCTGL